MCVRVLYVWVRVCVTGVCIWICTCAALCVCTSTCVCVYVCICMSECVVCVTHNLQNNRK